jgi:hypothetical protein
MNSAWLAIIAGLVGIAVTLAAWFFNPKRRYQQELDHINSDLAVFYQLRDRALDEDDTDTLTRVTADINGLQSRRNEVLQRLG